jgi:L-ascorbate metabolism protein UlaG (beta-lactamase superfamily)
MVSQKALGVNMKKGIGFFAFPILSVICLLVFVEQTPAACRNPNLVDSSDPHLIYVGASKFVEIEWFGHSFFQITSSSGTKVITDPFYPMGYPMPEVWPHVVTVGREYRNHNNIGLAKGNPIILRGLVEGTLEWNDINKTVRDILIYNVPIFQRGYAGYRESLQGSAFVFEVDGLCILHSGDVSEPFNEDQLQFIGNIDILLVPIGGRFTTGPAGAQEIIEQLKPKIIVPMHYFSNSIVLDQFIDGPYPPRFLEINRFSVSRDTLPQIPEIIVPKVIWHGREFDY